MKTRLATGALVGAILMGDYQPEAQADPQPQVIGIDDCIEFAAGCVFFAAVWSCWYRGWDKFWNGSPTNNTVVTSPPLPLPWEPIDGPGGGLDSVGKLHMNGPYSYGITNSTDGWTNMVVFIKQASADLVNWTNQFAFKVWESPAARLMVVSSPEGVPLWTNLAPRGADGRSTNYCPLIDSPKDKSKEFFRLLSQ